MAKAHPDPVHILNNPTGPVTAVASFKLIKEGEENLLSGSETGSISIWDLNVFRPLKSWQAHKNAVLWLAGFDDKPGQIISQGRRESIVIWNSEGTSLIQIPTDHDGFCKSDLLGNKLAVPMGKYSIDLYDIGSAFVKRTSLNINTDEGAIMAIEQLDQSRIVAAYESGFICIWNEDVINQTRVDSMPICICCNSQRNEILLGTASEILYVFDSKRLTRLKEVSLTNPGLNSIALRSSDSRVYATAGWDKRLRLFSARTHKKLCVLQLHDGSLNGVVFSVGRRCLLAAGGSDALISLWDLYGSQDEPVPFVF